MVRLATYNCNSIGRNAEIAKSILKEVDILFLQELLLCKSDLHILQELDKNFDNVAYVMDRESEGIIEGRPSRGVAILWRKSLFPNVKPLIIDDSCIGIFLLNGNSNLFLLNVYMPCDLQTFDALDSYRNVLAKIKVIVNEQSYTDIIIGGDFNADPGKGRFWKELEDFTRSLSLTVLDSSLPQETFT